MCLLSGRVSESDFQNSQGTGHNPHRTLASGHPTPSLRCARIPIEIYTEIKIILGNPTRPGCTARLMNTFEGQVGSSSVQRKPGVVADTCNPSVWEVEMEQEVKLRQERRLSSSSAT